MLLTLRTTMQPATDLGYLLHKNPARAQSFDLTFGTARVFYPEASPEACTAALLLEIDPVQLVRGGNGGEGALDQYVNDRPYAASSFLSVAIGQVFRSAMAGACKERPALASTPIPLEAHLPVVPSRGGDSLLRALFEPLGYVVTARRPAPASAGEERGESHYFAVTLSGTICLGALLNHLYVLVPVLDDDKHYFVGSDEVEKLLRHGAGWLDAHPARDLITRRYLRHRRSLVDAALARLTREEDSAVAERAHRDAGEEALERPLSLHDQRLALVRDILVASGARRVVDLGCGEGKLLRLLLAERQFETIVGMDVAHRSLEVASERLKLDRIPEMQRERITLLHGSLMYRDARLHGFDAAAVIEVIEHLDAARLAAFERVVFEFARPGLLVVTTPNAEYNGQWPSLPAGRFRHPDHRFEWTRAEFADWSRTLAARTGYSVAFHPVGPEHPEVGAPTQMAVFTR